MDLEGFVERADQLIAMARAALGNLQDRGYDLSVRSELFSELRSASLSLIESVFSKEHSYYREFDKKVKDVSDFYTRHALGILTAIRSELAGGWIRTTRGLVSAEVFADFLEMADHLLGENYRDAAAVMVGSVLEEHLHQMAVKYDVATEEVKGDRTVRKKANVINADLVKAGAYNKLDEKNVTSWLDLRNRAAHGDYESYTKPQVELLRASVADFIARHTL